MVATLRAEQIDDFKKHLRKSGTRSAEEMKPATINLHLALLRSALRWAASNNYAHGDPMARVKMLDEENERDRICSRGEFEALIGAASPKVRAVDALCP
ncbi:MAG: hypothetical protein HYV07_14215 [Deltaproteobacteria bacterium]|nr:hypothetical protein [Deltaproteobacteria bacterium]